jgi:hypothetical protein
MATPEKISKKTPQKTPEQLIERGFNHGYLLAKFEPELAAKLAAQTNEQSPYFKGLVSGKNEYDAEVNAWAKSFTRGKSGKDALEKDRGTDKER